MRLEIDGRPAPAGFPALASYGHFTAMQVRDGAVRGLPLHLRRLDSAHRELFGAGLDGDLVRARVRHALGGERDASVRVYAVQREDGDTSVVVTVRPPAPPPAAARSLMSVPYLRPVAHVKAMAHFGQGYYIRLAERAGFDDALLTGPGGVVAEAGIANLGACDGTAVVWPDAPALAGITMQLLDRDLPGAGVPARRATVRVADLPSYRAVFVTNSHGIAPVSRVDDVELPVDAGLVATLRCVYESVPFDDI